jgi:hypothetical protein
MTKYSINILAQRGENRPTSLAGFLLLLAGCSNGADKPLSDYVNPFIGASANTA